jgi:glutathione peroxidase
MTLKQSILKWMYPLLIKSRRNSNKGLALKNNKNVSPFKSFYDLKGVNNSGAPIDFSIYKGKKILLVNTASNCGYTGQYESLQSLSEQYKDRLIVLGFPSNDFKEQEKSSDAEINQFCQINFGVTFPLMKKSVVVKHTDQNSVFAWLSNAELNGWNSQDPVWNFSKYLVDENGKLNYVFGPSVDPLDSKFIEAVKE